MGLAAELHGQPGDVKLVVANRHEAIEETFPVGCNQVREGTRLRTWPDR